LEQLGVGLIYSDHEEAGKGNPEKNIPQFTWLKSFVGFLVAEIEDGKTNHGQHDGLHGA